MKDATQTGWVIDVTEENFEDEVVERSKTVPVVIDFWAPWCGPCKTLGPVLESVTRAKAGQFVLAKVNIDESPNLAQHFGIESVPTVHALRDGQFIPGFVGIPTEEQVKDFFDQILPSETDNSIKEAQALEATNPAEAEKIYRSILTPQPDHELARVSLARVLVGLGNIEEAKHLLSPLGVSGDVGTEAERLRRIIEVQGDTPATGDEAALQKQIEADPENAKLRLELGTVLASRSKYPEALEILLSAAELDKNLAK
ncbi:MAG: tetratricopeptide repeat protein, partial [Planctomycetes bacterium]|nr:tetratricopeptide repeat protein [Planctomycetota bacterium]